MTTQEFIQHQRALRDTAKETLDRHLKTIEYYRQQAGDAVKADHRIMAERAVVVLESGTASLQKYYSDLVAHVEELEKRYPAE